MNDEERMAWLKATQQDLKGGAEKFDPTMGGAFTVEQSALLAQMLLTRDTMTLKGVPVAHLYAAAVALLASLPSRDMSETMAQVSLDAANGLTSTLDDAFPGVGAALLQLQRFLSSSGTLDEE